MIRYGERKRRIAAGLERAMRAELDPHHPLDRLQLKAAGGNADALFGPLRPMIRKKLRKLLAGDAEAARTIACIAPNHWRAQIVRELWAAGLSGEPLRELLQAVWEHDHGRMYAHCHDLVSMFIDADYRLPDWLGETVTAWRGSSDISPAKAAQGLSWTTDQSIAAWFALRYGGAPTVIKAEIPREDIAAYFDGRDEKELIVIEPPARYQVDGTPAEWLAWGKQIDGVFNGISTS